MGLSLTDTQLDQLLAYLTLIQKWNKVYNLTAVREPQAMLTQHLVDSLSLLPALRSHARGKALRMMDVGSGGGLPGVVVAICEPGIDVTCVDAVSKKATFIKQVAAELRLPNLHGEHSRVETLKAEPFDLITSRAFASLLDFTTLTRQHLRSDAIWLAMKELTWRRKLLVGRALSKTSQPQPVAQVLAAHSRPSIAWPCAPSSK